ncbi:unnamed protein product [Rotaria sordida]|uniref:Peptidase S9 prolyl oligopeptidase catalytic domain-containing protein n=1 Tax=Rotaria sordida TaxID=392033 RepID=A0A814BB91_9BILA|nr:unnamed protein product [Rotaria sordida]CAF1380095.1 unnamed protein product [Rotaria sordida]
MMLMKIFLLLILQLFSCFSIETKPRLTFDEFFDYTRYSLLEFSPTGRHLLFQTICPSWNTSSYQHALWLYDIEKQTKKLIATNTFIPIQAKWSPSGNYIALLLKSYSLGNVTGRPSINDLFLQRIYLYSLISDKLLPIKIEKHIFLTFTWSNNDSSLYIATKSFWSFYKQNILYQHEWKNAVPYREKMQFIHSCSIYRIDLNLNNLSLPVKRKFIRHLSFSISQLLYVSFEEQLIFLPSPTTSEDLGDLEIYSINLQNTSKLSKLTNNEVVEWSSLAASEGWLVLEPNYRGSTGYGDQFVNEIQHRPLSKPGKDILYGVDQLIKDGIADPYRLAVGGYSYGGYLTNWLITQTKRFNAALSGAGVVDLASAWGRMDQPLVIRYLFGGLPWEVPSSYQNEAPIYYLNRVRTPTHIITGEDDKRVPASESYILERALYHLGIPVQLITFPNEGHSLNDNPWYGKIKIREELKWLQKYVANITVA